MGGLAERVVSTVAHWLTFSVVAGQGSAVVVSTTARRLKEEHNHDVEAILAHIPLQ